MSKKWRGLMRKNKKDEAINGKPQSLEKEQEKSPTGVRKLSILLFGVLLLSVVGCATFLAVHFNDPEYFKYGCGSVFTALVLVALFGWPFED